MRSSRDSCGRANSAAPDRAFATELFYGVLRNLTLLDFWIDALRSGHLDHDSRDLLRLGLYQLFLLQTPEHAAVFETVELAGARARSLVNAVLRNALRRKEELLERGQAAGSQRPHLASAIPDRSLDAKLRRRKHCSSLRMEQPAGPDLRPDQSAQDFRRRISRRSTPDAETVAATQKTSCA